MAAAVARPLDIPSRSPTPAHPQLTLNTSTRGTPIAVPNKHIPYSSPGPIPKYGPTSPLTPEYSPPGDVGSRFASPLSPADSDSLISKSPPVYAISAASLAEAVEQLATQPLPDPSAVFPWLHGLHADNQIQLSFFLARKKALRKAPKCLRSLTIVKVGGNLSVSKLKGAILAEELLLPTDANNLPSLQDADPRFGFSVRNFQIQACKLATISDLVVYGDDSTPREDVEALARSLSHAQQTWKQRLDPDDSGHFSTFAVTDAFSVFEQSHPELVAINSKGKSTGKVMDFFVQERIEMCTLSKASEIAPNVWLGPTPNARSLCPAMFDPKENRYDICIEACDFAKMPDEKALEQIEDALKEPHLAGHEINMEFPSSGSVAVPAFVDVETGKILLMCKWIHKMANGSKRTAGDSEKLQKGHKILIHCADGYTETSLLALAYFMYAEGLSAYDAWLRLHCEKDRNFFAYPTDKSILELVEASLVQASPKAPKGGAIVVRPAAMERMDGSLPSRILPYMYLGNLLHAQNPKMLQELGITHVLSVGEAIKWPEEETKKWGKENLLYIDKVQDNGIDPLTHEFGRCLEFIERAKNRGQATLVHCRVGVSRSATICIAEVMNELGLTFPRAYCFVRARRLNVIIQPHLRFTYELMKWEEYQCIRRGEPVRRELEWATVAREIALMNKPYCRT